MKKKILFTALLVISISLVTNAQDRQFAQTYQSITLPQGVRDIEIWNTYATGSNTFYKGLMQRIEFETGLTDKLQTSIYININTIATAINDSSPVLTNTSFSVSNEWKYKILNPNSDFMGLGLYAELQASTSEFELETKILLDKNIGNEIFALNLINEFENEFGRTPKDDESENHPELDLGYMHKLKPNFGLGFEFRENNTVSDEKGWEYSTLFLGPTMFYSGKSCSLILNIMPQIQNFHKTAYAPGNLVLGDYPKLEVRLIFSFNGV
jgi:hypothetical protein